VTNDTKPTPHGWLRDFFRMLTGQSQNFPTFQLTASLNTMNLNTLGCWKNARAGRMAVSEPHLKLSAKQT